MASSPPTEPIMRLLARVIVDQARRQAAHENAAQELLLLNGDASKTPGQENIDASPFYPRTGATAT